MKAAVETVYWALEKELVWLDLHKNGLLKVLVVWLDLYRNGPLQVEQTPWEEMEEYALIASRSDNNPEQVHKSLRASIESFQVIQTLALIILVEKLLQSWHKSDLSNRNPHLPWKQQSKKLSRVCGQ